MPPRTRSDAAAEPEPRAESRTEDGATAPMIPGTRIPLPALPSGAAPKRALWWGGLAALAVVGALEWPVAVAVGAGGYVAERLARENRSDGDGQPA